MKKDLDILSECLKFIENKFGLEYLENSEYEVIGKNGKQSERIKAKTPKIISLYKSGKKDLINNSNVTDNNIKISEKTIEFVQLISSLNYGEIEQDFFDDIYLKLKSSEPKDYFGIKCELSVYQRYKMSGLPIKKIPEITTSTPDFEIKTENEVIYIECKSILSESIKLTPRLSSFLKNLLGKINDNIIINIVLDSKDAKKYEPEIREIFELAIETKEEKLYKGRYSQLQLINPKISTEHNTDFIIPNFDPSTNIGSFKGYVKDGKMVSNGGINFLPFFPNEYKQPLSKHLKKANSQIEKLGKGILHIQFPSMKVNELHNLISQHGHRIQDYINKHSLLAVVINVPYLIQKNNIKNELVPDINISYFKASSELRTLLEKKPYWLKNYKLIESIEKGNVIYFEFETYTPLNSFVLNLRNSKLSLNIKIFIIGNRILYESIIEESCKVRIIKIPLNLIKKKNKLTLTVGDVESIYINGQKLGTTPCKKNCW
jgi:hypothetical protein